MLARTESTRANAENQLNKSGTARRQPRGVFTHRVLNVDLTEKERQRGRRWEVDGSLRMHC